MSYYYKALKAEFIKKRRTGTYMLCVALGVFIPLIYFVTSLSQNDGPGTPGIPFNYYKHQFEAVLSGFGYFFFPLLIIIAAAKITHVDDKNRGWDLMETQPLTKFSIYFSKLTVLLLGNLLAILSFLGSTILIAYALSVFKTVNVNAVMHFSLGYVAQLGVRLFVAGLFLSAFQLLLSICIKNFITPILIGFFGLVGTLLLSIIWKIDKMWNPFTILKHTADFGSGSAIGHFFLYTEIISLIGFAVFILIGFLYYKNKTFKRTFLRTRSLWVILTAAGLGVLAIFLVNRPKVRHQYKKTVLSGYIESSYDFNQIVLIDPFTRDSLASIPIKNNHFHYYIPTKLPLDTYTLAFSGQSTVRLNLVMSTNDSLHIVIQDYHGKAKLKTLTGTRLAENKYHKETAKKPYISYMVSSDLYLDRPKEMIQAVYNHWKSAYRATTAFRTRDNYTLRPDFIEKAKKLTTVEYLNLWHQYLDKEKVVNPSIKDSLTEKIKEMKACVPLHDNSLISNKDYLDYVLYEMTGKDTSNVDFLTRRFRAIKKMKASNFKDRMLFSTLKEAITATADREGRQKLVATHKKELTDKSLRRKIIHLYHTKNSLAKGRPAPGFAAENVDKTQFRLSEFRGKLLVIDVWATWCGPCLQQAPYFEREALKYKNNPDIVFMALSIDKERRKWYLQAKDKSPSVLQLHLPKAVQKKFKKDYAVKSIPRYIFIDEAGNFIDSAMDYPSRDKFETEIKQVLQKREKG